MMMFGKNFKRGIDISPQGIRWVELKAEGDSFVSSDARFVEVPEGLIGPSFAKENISDKDMLRSLILEAIPAGKRSGEIGLSIPDHLVKISSVEFEDLPAKKSEVERLISWRMKKSLPLSPEKMKAIIQAFKAGKTPKAGPQIERQTSAPAGGPTTLVKG